MDKFARYTRQMILPEIGIEGQQRIHDARVLCIGAGGLGSPVLLYLAAAGVGHLGIVDNDRVDLSNLQRQVLYGTDDIGQFKTKIAARRLHELNPNIEIVTYNERFTAQNAEQILSHYDIVIDGTDNFPTRFLVNDVCVRLQKPLVYGSILKFDGQVSLFDSTIGPCYRCLFPELPGADAAPNCTEAGVLGVLPGIIGSLQATETLKWILKTGESLLGRVMTLNALTMQTRIFTLQKDPNCPTCSDSARNNPEPLSDYTMERNCTMSDPLEMSVEELKARLDSGEKLIIIDVREPDEHEVCKIPGAKLIPLGTIPDQAASLDRNCLTVLHCHHGRRSRKAVDFLCEQGFTNVRNLTGGIHEWAECIDPQMTRY